MTLLERRNILMRSGNAIDWKAMYMAMIDGSSFHAIVPKGTILMTGAFRDRAMVSIDLPEDLPYIPNYTFLGAKNIISVEVPSSVEWVGQQVFDGNMTSLQYIIFNSTTPPTIWLNSIRVNVPIYVPDESVEDYKAANNWSALADRIFPISELGGA